VVKVLQFAVDPRTELVLVHHLAAAEVQPVVVVAADLQVVVVVVDTADIQQVVVFSHRGAKQWNFLPKKNPQILDCQLIQIELVIGL
jgi:hypothetical protein